MDFWKPIVDVTYASDYPVIADEIQQKYQPFFQILFL